jgi:putative flippase GtrA
VSQASPGNKSFAPRVRFSDTSAFILGKTMQTELAKPPPSERRYLRNVLNGHDPLTFARFIFVGGLAFAVNYLAFWVFYDSLVAGILPDKDAEIDFLLFSHPDARLLFASMAAVEIAILFKFLVHEFWTFRGKSGESKVVSRLVQFNFSAMLAAIAPIITVNVLAVAFGFNPYVAMLVGVAVGFLLNWFWSAHLIWPGSERATSKQT